MGVRELSSAGLTLSEATANVSISFKDGVMPSAMENDTSGTMKKLF